MRVALKRGAEAIFAAARPSRAVKLRDRGRSQATKNTAAEWVAARAVRSR